ncbi:MAG TPA: cytochrome c biogenesis heme-transporting ATPase CcmA [Usitatibacteraceae bacterium]|nr:cytochrome c biogenesis heme-transporting ATPase CcmA [Usitatibacteraceae bacterium]
MTGKHRSGAADILQVRELACRRGPALLFSGLGFEVASGELLCVRGPNGCGKTTLLRCVTGLTRPDEGTILWHGESSRTEPERMRAGTAYAGHLPGLKDDLTAEENLEFSLRLRGTASTAEQRREALAAVGLEKRRRLPARRLSAGQRRRIGLAWLSLDPAEFWALDEPLTALDDAGQALFVGLLERHLANGGLALVATHHRLAPSSGVVRELRLA